MENNLKDKIFLHSFEQIEESTYLVRGVNFQPHIIKPRDENEGVYILKEDFPQQDVNKSKVYDAVLLYNKETAEVFYQYTEKEIELTESDKKIEILEQQVADLSFLVMKMQGQLQGGVN